MKALLVGVAALALAAAAPPCLSGRDLEAAEAIHFQTELMVVSETCHQPIYVDFLRRHRSAIAAYQKRMIAHYRRRGAQQPQARLDSYMTHLANKASLAAAQEPTAALCQEKAEFLEKAKAFDDRQLRRYVADRAKRASEAERCED